MGVTEGRKNSSKEDVMKLKEKHLFKSFPGFFKLPSAGQLRLEGVMNDRLADLKSITCALFCPLLGKDYSFFDKVCK